MMEVRHISRKVKTMDEGEVAGYEVAGMEVDEVQRSRFTLRKLYKKRKASK